MFCRVSLCLFVGVALVVFVVECVVVVVMVDNDPERVENMVDVVVIEECWYLVWWVGGPSISSPIMEYGLVVSKSFLTSRLGSAPRRTTSDSPPLNEIKSSSKILPSSSLFVWLSMTGEKLGVNNRVASQVL